MHLLVDQVGSAQHTSGSGTGQFGSALFWEPCTLASSDAELIRKVKKKLEEFEPDRLEQ